MQDYPKYRIKCIDANEEYKSCFHQYIVENNLPIKPF